jgi:hypothetical protein
MFITGIFLYISAVSAETSGIRPLYFVGINGSLNLRRGSYEFEEYALRQDTSRHIVPMLGFSAGKRYFVSDVIRIVPLFSLNFGSAVQDTILDEYGIKNTFFNFDFSPEIQFATPGMDQLRPFLFAGGGINFVRMKESFYSIYDPEQPIAFTSDSDMDPVVAKRWCPHANAGIGFDIMPRRDIGISIRYQLRYWIPVKYSDSRDFPVDEIDYKEAFLTNMLQVQLLLAFEE